MAAKQISKALDRLALCANRYTHSLGTVRCDRAFERLKRAARNYANAIRTAPSNGGGNDAE
jgi:hypothetical protein